MILSVTLIVVSTGSDLFDDIPDEVVYSERPMVYSDNPDSAIPRPQSGFQLNFDELLEPTQQSQSLQPSNQKSS